jgi:large subunit ribosomal protein L25
MELQVQKREIIGKQVGALRKKGLIPAELYGKKAENLHLAVRDKDFRKIFKQAGESSLVNIILDLPAGKKNYPTIINNVQFDPITDEILSIDFYQVRLDEEIKIRVPLEFIGEAPAAKEKDGVLVKAVHEIELETLPGNIPHSIIVKLDGLKDIHQSIYIKDLNVSSDIRLMVPPETVVATVIPKLTEEQEQAMAAEITPETIVAETEEKKAERLAQKIETPSASSETPPK